MKYFKGQKLINKDGKICQIIDIYEGQCYIDEGEKMSVSVFWEDEMRLYGYKPLQEGVHFV